jgi:hypothetical protein
MEFLLNYISNLDVTVQQVTLLFHIQEILGSNFNLNITYLEGFVVSSSSFRQMPEQNLKVDHDHFLPQKQNKLRGLSPQANYTDRGTATRR